MPLRDLFVIANLLVTKILE